MNLSELKEEKKKLRETLRAAAAVEAADDAAEKVVAAIERLPEFAAARTVALFCSLGDEIATDGMLNRWHGAKRLALPVVEGGEMNFREYGGPGTLSRGPFGIAQPTGGGEVSPSEIDLVIVPGVAFDAAGHRLGRGAGFYDRWLGRADAAHVYKVGVCLPHQLVDRVPCEAHDVRMDRVIAGDDRHE